MESLRDIALELARDAELAADILHGEKAFSADIDLSEMPDENLSLMQKRERAKQYLILERRVPALQALDWGLCEEVAADGGALAAVNQLAYELLSLPSLPLRMSKQAINASANALNHLGSLIDRDQCLLTMQLADLRKAVTVFIQKREAQFTGN